MASTVAVQSEVVRNGHRATRDVRRMALPTSQGSKTPSSQTPFRCVARRHCARALAGSGASRPQLRVLRFRRPFQVRLLRQACRAQTRDVSPLSVHDQRGEVEAHPSLLEAESLRCETVQVEGRHPYLVTRAAVLRRSLHAHKSRDKGV